MASSPAVVPPSEESIMTDITKFNFIEQSNDFITRLPNAAWIAIDEEMTGIMLPGSKRPAKDESPAERYSSLKRIPERYSIIQLGICLFEEATTATTSSGVVDTAKFHVRRYKFTLFPPADNNITREITFNPSSIHFLAQNNMNFNHMVKAGIPYVTKENADRLTDKFYEKQLAREEESKKPPENNNNRRRVELTRVEDKNFHARSMASLREWLDAAIPNAVAREEGATFLLPPCNSFLRRALYESIGKEYPNLILETISSTSSIRVLRLNPAEKKRRNQRLLREGWERLLTEKIGVYRIFLALTKACTGTAAANQAEHIILASSVEDAMTPLDASSSSSLPATQRKTPLVVHNGLQDLFFLLTHFHSAELPDAWADCKSILHSYFPVIYDTKCMASEYAARENPRGATHLQAVYEQTLATNPQWNRVFVANDSNSSEQEAEENQEQAHDAAYDAYMTGAAFCGLAYAVHNHVGFPKVANRTSFQLWNSDPTDEAFGWMYGRNKLHFHLSPYTIDLESPDSDALGRGMSAVSTFRVADIDATVSTRDIVRCLTGLSDSHGDRVNFEIIWVDDTTFLVGAMLPNCHDFAKFQEHGKVLLQALSATFRRKSVIQCLQDTMQMSQGDDKRKAKSNFWNLWGMLGSKKKKRMDEPREGQEGRSKKRRRIV